MKDIIEMGDKQIFGYDGIIRKKSWFRGQYRVDCPKCEKNYVNKAGTIYFDELNTPDKCTCGGVPILKIVYWVEIHIKTKNNTNHVKIEDIEFVGRTIVPKGQAEEYARKRDDEKNKRLW